MKRRDLIDAPTVKQPLKALSKSGFHDDKAWCESLGIENPSTLRRCWHCAWQTPRQNAVNALAFSPGRFKEAISRWWQKHAETHTNVP